LSTPSKVATTKSAFAQQIPRDLKFLRGKSKRAFYPVDSNDFGNLNKIAIDKAGRVTTLQEALQTRVTSVASGLTGSGVEEAIQHQPWFKSGIDKLYQAGAESQQANLARNYAQNNIGGLGITRPSRETAKRLGAKIEKSNKIHSGALDEEMKEIRFVENYRRREAAGFGNGRKKRELVGVPHSGGRFDQ
ncbi:hypothetical protein, partial [Pseudomonas savastanoi]|uniref:hypothetical protein n=1 Tax=Pseudomonas savastanoi TaxID=29438 RepID=UPI001604D4D9